MSRLYSGRRLMFERIDASERSTQLRINEILAEMRRPVDEIQPRDLEEILKEITIQFSRLSPHQLHEAGPRQGPGPPPGRPQPVREVE